MAPRPGFTHRTAEIGNPPEHREWSEGCPNYGVEIHPTAQINAFVTVDGGFRGPTTIGADTFLMAHVHVGHDAVVGNSCELAPGTVIGGHCEIGDSVRFGVNSCVRPFIRIGDGARIGAGAVVVKDVPAGEVWVGNPARPLEPRAISSTEEEWVGYEAERAGWEEWWEKAHQNQETAAA